MRGTTPCNTRAPCLPAENLAFWCCLLSSHTAQPYPHTRQPSPHTADATLLVLHTFSPGTADVTFLILHPFSTHHAACFSTAHVTLLILQSLYSHCTMLLCSFLFCILSLMLQNLFLVLQMQPSWY